MVALVGGGVVAPVAAPAGVGLSGCSAIGPVAGNARLKRILSLTAFYQVRLLPSPRLILETLLQEVCLPEHRL